MGFLKSAVIFICLFLLFLGTLSLLFFGTAYFSILDKNTYDQMIDAGILDDAVPALLALGLEQKTNAGERALSEALKESLTKEWVRKEAKNVVGGTLAYLKSENQKFDVKIDLMEVKPKLSEALWNYTVKSYGSGLEAAITDAMLKENPNVNISARSIEEAMQKCKGSSADKKCETTNGTGQQDVLATKQWVEGKLAEFLAKVPDVIDVNELFFQGNAEERLEPTRQAISTVSTAIYALIAIQIVLLAIIYWLFSKNTASFLRWAGVAILLAALLSLAAAYFANNYVSSQVAQMGQEREVEVDGTALTTVPTAPGFIISLVLGLSAKVFSDVLMWSIGILVLAVLMIAGSFVLKRNETKEEAREGKKQKR